MNCSDEENGVFYFYGNVTISPFAMGQYEVTQELYKAIMDKNPSTFNADTLTSDEIQELRPVDSVNWYQAVAFCNKLTKQTFGEQYCVYYSDSSYSTVYTTTDASDEKLPYFDQSKKGYRLPTQVEWEFAARGGDELQECWSYPYPGLSEDTNDSLLTIAWFESNANSVSHEVGLKTPNTLSLYDMAGNLMEWCWDYYLEDFSIGNGNNPTGPDSGEERILCGGYFDDYSDSCYSYSSTSYSPIPNDNWINTVGFRICRSL